MMLKIWGLSSPQQADLLPLTLLQWQQSPSTREQAAEDTVELWATVKGVT